jgi:transcriptional regulator with XRE-family HTH domain
VNDGPHESTDLSDQDWLERVGDAVRLARLVRKVTQEELAAAAHIRPNTLIDVEKGRRAASVITLRHIAQALHVDVATFFP